MILPNTKYRFLRQTAVGGKPETPVVADIGEEFVTNGQTAWDAKLANHTNHLGVSFFSKTVPTYVLESWLEDGRIEFVGRWKPNRGEEYFYITHGGSVATSLYKGNTQFNKPLFAFGNCFETREQAVKMSGLIKDLLVNVRFEEK